MKAHDAANRRSRALFLASAGSGKTHQISSTIIGLLAGGEDPGAIFASTFTRKAAGEILDRVLLRLAKASRDDEAAADLSRDASDGGERDVALDPAGWADVLARTVRSVHRLEIGTLDSFFLRALGAFANELGLPPRWSIVDEATAAELRADALEAALAALDRGARIELVRGIASGRARRSVHDTLFRMLTQLGSLHHSIAPDAPGWGALAERYGTDASASRARLTALADAVAETELPLTQTGQPMKVWERAVEKMAAAMRGEDPESIADETLFQRATSDVAEEFSRRPIPPALSATLGEAAGHLATVVGVRLASRASALGRLAELYTTALDERIQATGALRFEDVPRFLSGPTPTGARDDLRYRMDSAIRHILLDEFQDTSLEQWDALRPMMDAAPAGSGDSTPDPDASLIVVADPKQSIYGWRGAAPVVVHAVGDRYKLEERTLNTSWRSSRVVLDAVNQVFQELPFASVFDTERGDDRTAKEWARDFQPHVPAREERPGHVRLLVGPEKTGKEATEFIGFVGGEIAALHLAAPNRSIGVLARRNATVARLIHDLRSRGIPASEEGGTPLMDSGAVASVVALLRVADHPGDTLSRYHAANTPVGSVVALGDGRNDEVARRVALDLRRALLEDGYGPTLSALVAPLRKLCAPRDRRRLAQLVDFGYGYDISRRSERVADFIRAVESERVEAQGTGEVRVMTIHGSKGLEFDSVVLPELDGSWFQGGGLATAVGFRPSGTSPVTHAFPWVKDSERTLMSDFPELLEAHEQARAARLRDDLGSLYVGMTRARHALHMILPADGESGPGSARSSARLLRERLSEPDTAASPGDVLFESGDPEWSAGRGDSEADTRSETTDRVWPVIQLRRTGPRSRHLPRLRPSSLHGEGISVQQLLDIRVTASLARHRGTLLHSILEELGWIEEFAPVDEMLMTRARTVAPELDEAEVQEAIVWLQSRLRVPEIRAALSSERYPDGAQARTEVPFLLRTADSMMEGIIDRVVVWETETGKRSAEVMDYKSDRIDPGAEDGIEDAVRRYAPQLRAYAGAVQELFDIPEGQVGASLILLGPGVVRSVPLTAGSFP